MKLTIYKNGDFAFSLELKENTAVSFPAGFTLAPDDTLQVITVDKLVTVNTITKRLEDVTPGTETNDFSNDFSNIDFS